MLLVCRHPGLLHGQVKTPLDEPIEYGCYLGYIPAVSREEYSKVCGMDELADRKESYQQGRAPKLWPSLDEIQYYPKRYANDFAVFGFTLGWHTGQPMGV